MGKNVILGVTGSIAAYKAADLTSLLVKQGCDVRVLMTADALRFITPLPFKTLSRHPVITDLYDEEEGWKPVHIEIRRCRRPVAGSPGNRQYHGQDGPRHR